MRVWVVKVGEQLPIGTNIRKMRALQLCEALAERGHEVTWWTSAFNHFQKSWYFEQDTDLNPSENFTIRAVKGLGYKRNFSLRRLVDHRLLSKRFARLIPHAELPDVMVIAIPAYDVAYRFAKFAIANGIPYIIDARDKWPDSFVDINFPFVKPLGGLVLAYEKYMTRFAIRNATRHVAMSGDMARWLEGYQLKDAGNSTVVIPLGFSRPATCQFPSAEVRDLFSRLAGKKVVTFVGTFGKYHDPTVMIEACKKMLADDVAFVIVGAGEMAGELHKLAESVPGVYFTGWLDMDDIDYILTRSHVGVCSTGATLEREFFPNKVFLYLSYGLSVASMFQGELHKLIDEKKIGFNFETPDQLAAGLSQLFKDGHMFDMQSQAAITLFCEKYDADSLMNLYCDCVLSVQS